LHGAAIFGFCTTSAAIANVPIRNNPAIATATTTVITSFLFINPPFNNLKFDLPKAGESLKL
jgi:hypothetical protein